MTTSSITPEDAFVRRSVQALAPETPRPRGSIGFDLSGDGGGNCRRPPPDDGEDGPEEERVERCTCGIEVRRAREMCAERDCFHK